MLNPPVHPVPVTSSISPSRQIPIVCPGHTRPLAELQFCSIRSANPDEESRTFLVSACHDKRPMLRDGKSGDWVGTFVGHKGAVWSTKLDPSGSLAATAGGDFSVKVWDGITGGEVFTFPHLHVVKSVDFSLDSRYLATGGHEGLLRIYSLEMGAKSNPIIIPQLEEEDKKVIITKCVWLTNKIVLVAASDGKIRAWDIENSQLKGILSVNAEVRDMELSSPSNILTVAAGDMVTFFQLINDGTGSLIHSHQMPIHFRNEGGCSLHPSGLKFVVGGSDLWVRVFDFNTGEELECLKGHHGPIRCVRYAPCGEMYASGSEDGTIRLWRTNV